MLSEEVKKEEKVAIKKPAKVSGIAKVAEGTLKVAVESVWSHRIYKKQQKRSKNYLVCCPKNSIYSIGELVYITQCSRVSKRKSWKIFGFEA
jgi:ribosomal protein S17